MINQTEIDNIDLDILNLLQINNKLSVNEIANIVGLSPSPCARRVRLLYSEGYIAGNHATLNLDKVGIGLQVFVNIRLTKHSGPFVEEFEEAIDAMPEVTESFILSGEFDYMVKVLCKDIRAYENWIRNLQKLDMVNTMDSRFVIRALKTNGPVKL